MSLPNRSAFLMLALAAAAAALVRADDDEIELDEARVFIEFNSTDGDFGIQFFWDGDAWKRMRVFNHDEEVVLTVGAKENVKDQGLTEGFFESAEPGLDELSMEEFLERFPEGEYEFEGKTIEGEEIEGEDELTHQIPSPPSNLWPPDGARVNALAPLTVTFDPVTDDLFGEEIEVELYEVVLEVEEDELTRVFSIILPGDTERPAVTVPPEFLEPGGEYKYEVIVQEESGNRTITEAVFTT